MRGLLSLPLSFFGKIREQRYRALDLLKNERVEAILGPLTSDQAKFIAELGSKSHTPVISFSATSPFLLSPRTPYFVRTALSDSIQATAIAALIQSFGWNQVIPIFEDTDHGTGMIPYLVDALQSIGARVPYRSIISLPTTNDQILQELYNLKTMETCIFVVHASISLASRLFLLAKEAEMMTQGYVWIITYGLTDDLGFMDYYAIDTMHGVLTVKPYINVDSDRQKDFDSRWRKRFRHDNPTEVRLVEPSVYALWAYDTTWALALAAEGVHTANFSSSSREVNIGRLEFRPNGRRLLDKILAMNFSGVTGEFRLVNRQLDGSLARFEIINVVKGEKRRIGFWTSEDGISGRLESRAQLEMVVWPGDSKTVPKGVKGKMLRKEKLKIGIPEKAGIPAFVNREWNPLTNRNASGFSIEVFDTVMANLPYDVSYEYSPFQSPTNDDLVYQVYLQNFDAAVGDVTITPNRSLYVDFTVPYTQLGISMVVPIKNNKPSKWTFLQPLTRELWLAIGAFFIYTGFVVWVLEHQINDGFRGPPLHQFGTVCYFSFSTLVFAHREKVVGNFTRVVMIIWLFVLLILTSSYTASFTSMLTVKQLYPAVTSLPELIKNGEYVGCRTHSNIWRVQHIDMSMKVKYYETDEEYDEALTKGSSRGGVSAIIDEIPYIEVFLSKYCEKYTMVGDIYRTGGFGFVFPKGSPLVSDVSKTILKFTEEIDTKLNRKKITCLDKSNSAYESLALDSFRGLFLITGITSTSALVLFVAFFLYEHRHALTNGSESSIWQRLAIIIKLFDKKDNSPNSAAICPTSSSSFSEATQIQNQQHTAACCSA